MNQKIHKLLQSKSGIKLDLGCGKNKQANFVGIDGLDLPGVDIVHNLENFPYPLPDECCLMIIGSHIVEHICPKKMIDFMNELWRITKPGGQLAFSYPYGGSPGFWQDPSHCNGCSQATWQYFDPRFPLYEIYRPKPWFIESNFWKVIGNGEVVMHKMTEKEVDKAEKKI